MEGITIFLPGWSLIPLGILVGGLIILAVLGVTVITRWNDGGGRRRGR